MIRKLTVLASDIDGTLTVKGGNIMPLTRKYINELHDAGVLFGPASGRPIDDNILNRAKQWKLDFDFDFAIGMNGGELYDGRTGELHKYYLLPKEKIRKILTFLKPFDCNAIVYKDAYREVRCLRMDDFMRDSERRNHSHVIVGDIDTLSEYDTGKIEVQFRDSQRDGILQAIRENQDPAWTYVQTYHQNGHCTFEFQDPRVNKGVALRALCEKYSIPMEEVMAFGDQENDIGLLKTAGWGVCLSNGADASKAVAQAVTEHDVTHDGVGHYLEDHVIHQTEIPGVR